MFTSDTTGKKPVMVWIHGGGWSMGNPEEYNGTALAGTGENISITYESYGMIHKISVESNRC